MLDFVNPWLLWGALLGVVPVLIHFFQRRSWNEVDWGAMIFLQRAVKRRQRQSRVESLLLLSVRCLIPILAAVALSQPIVTGLESNETVRSDKHWIFVVDRSLSMQTIVDGRSHFDVAREAILRTLESSRPGDMFSLIGICSVCETEVIGRPTRDRDEFARVVRRLEPTMESSELQTVLVELPERVRRYSKEFRSEVVVLSDFQSKDWDAADGRVAPIRDQLVSIAELTRVSLVDVAPGRIRNVGIHDLRVIENSQRTLSNAVPIANNVVTIDLDQTTDGALEPGAPTLLSVSRPATISITIEHHGVAVASSQNPIDDEAATRHAIQVAVENREIYGSEIGIQPGQRVQLHIPWTPTRPGRQRVSVQLSSDALASDDSRYCVVDVVDRIDALVIDGAPHARASRFVELALNPWQEASHVASGPPLSVTTAGIERLLEGDFEGYDLLILCDVPVLTENDVERLVRFVESGGGVILGLGPSTELDTYGRWAFSPEGLCALRIVESVGDPDAIDEPFRLVVDQPNHPVVARFASHPRAGLQTTRISRYVGMRIPETSSAEAVLSVGNGNPVLIEQSLGAGRCLIVTTALDDRWGSWVLWPSFVPLIHEMVRFVAGGRPEQQALVVGDTWRFWLPEDEPQPRLVVEGPSLANIAVKTILRSRGVQGEIGPLMLPGFYEMEYLTGNRPLNHLAVNVDATESLAAPADLEALNQLSEQVRVFSVETWHSRARATSESVNMESLLARRLLTVVLCLLLIEPILARTFRVGVVLLLVMSGAIVLQSLITMLW